MLGDDSHVAFDRNNNQLLSNLDVQMLRQMRPVRTRLNGLEQLIVAGPKSVPIIGNVSVSSLSSSRHKGYARSGSCGLHNTIHMAYIMLM